MASITTFATLKSELLTILGRAPADPVYQMVIREINRDMRLSVMEATTTETEAASISLPAAFLEVHSVYRDTDPRYPLKPTTAQGIHRSYDSSGIPREYAIVDDAGTKKMLLNPSPNGSENIIIRYYAALAELSADEDTNDFITYYPDIMVYGSLYHHAQLVGDDRLGIWEAAYAGARQRAKASDAKARVAGAPFAPTARTTP